MQVVPFDTLKFAKRLEKSGVPIQQAEVFAEGQRETLAELAEGHLATKSDIAGVKAEIAEVKTQLKAEIAEVKAELVQVKADIAQVKTDLDVKISQVKVDIAQVKAEVTQVKTELKADIRLVHWMMGLTLSGVVALVGRLFLGF